VTEKDAEKFESVGVAAWTTAATRREEHDPAVSAREHLAVAGRIS